MNFLYLVEWNFNGYSGVERKIRSQMAVWKHLDHSVIAVVIGKHSAKSKDELKQEGFDFWNIPDNKILQKLLLDQVIKQFFFILIFFKYFFRKIDFVYYRVSTLSFALVFLLRFKLVIEVNSIDSEAGSGLKKMIGPVADFYRSMLFRNASAYFFITHELEKYYSGKYQVLKERAFILGNGYWNSDFTTEAINDYFEKKKSVNRVRPVLLFIGSGNDAHYWHGYDKLIKLTEALPEFDFILVGEVALEAGRYPNLRIVQKMYKENVLELFSQSDIGIGTLALHRKNMNEASPLKVSEYVFFGLPVITAYYDVNVFDKAFNLQIENREDNINPVTIERIRMFVNNYFGYTLLPEERESVSLFQIEHKRLEYIKAVFKTEQIK